ncbi:hypothetical protein [Actinokineospora cianjurensis]|nr:hypothetical protein [Actinokineospora cianjurensis]
MTGWQDDNRPRRASRVPMALSVVAIVAAVATVVVLALVNRSSGDTPDEAAVTSTTGARPSTPTSRPPTTTSRPRRTSTTAPPPLPGRVIDNPAAHLSYRVPTNWQVDATAKPTVAGVDFSGTAAYGPYTCGGTGYSRAFATSATAQNPADKDVTAEKTATTFTSAFGRVYFPGATVASPNIRPLQVDGKKAVVATAAVTSTPADPKCASTKGEVAVLAIDLDNATDTRPRGIALLVVAADLAGGPDKPAPLTEATVEAILSGASLR